MSESEDLKKIKDDIEQLHLSHTLRIDSYLQTLKEKSSEAVLNGSVEDAQEMLSEILVIENERQKISASQKEFMEILND